jgi:hypothetical protein
MEEYESKKPRKVEFADSRKIEQHREAVDKLLRLIAREFFVDRDHPNPNAAIQEWMAYCFVSDKSSLADFLHDPAEDQCQRLSKKLGFSVQKQRPYL